MSMSTAMKVKMKKSTMKKEKNLKMKKSSTVKNLKMTEKKKTKVCLSDVDVEMLRVGCYFHLRFLIQLFTGDGPVKPLATHVQNR